MTVRLVDVGGYRLDIRASGSGSASVVCVSALGGAHDDWQAVARLLGETTTVVTYARPGLADSDPLPADEAVTPRDGAWVATQLRALLRNAEIAPPYILTSGSIGVFVVDQFAALWPDEVAGLVLHDPTNPRPFIGLAEPDKQFGGADGLADAKAGGINFSSDLLRSFVTVPAPQNQDGRFVVVAAADGDWLRLAPQEWHTPLTVADMDAQWIEIQREWAYRLRAEHVVADTAGHHVYRDEPKLTAYVIQAVVQAARDRRPLELDSGKLAAAGGHLAV